MKVSVPHNPTPIPPMRYRGTMVFLGLHLQARELMLEWKGTLSVISSRQDQSLSRLSFTSSCSILSYLRNLGYKDNNP